MAEIVSEDGDMRPCRTVKKGGLYWGGSAKLVQDAFGLSGDAFLYVGDHLFTDAALAKLNFQCAPPRHPAYTWLLFPASAWTYRRRSVPGEC